MFSSGCKVGFIVCNTVGLSCLENATVIRKLLWGILNVAIQLFVVCLWNVRDKMLSLLNWGGIGQGVFEHRRPIKRCPFHEGTTCMQADPVTSHP